MKSMSMSDESDFYINQFMITIVIVVVVAVVIVVVIIIIHIYLLGFQLTPEMSMLLFKIKAVTCRAAFCKHGIAIGISNFLIHFSRILVPVGNAPIIIGTTLALAFQIFANSVVKSCYFDTFHSPLEICLYHKVYLCSFY